MNTKRGPYKRKYPLDATERECRLCGVTKPVDQFLPHSTKSTGYVIVESRCNECRQRQKMLSRYGISYQEFQTMLDAQNNCCAICKGEFAKQPHVDHCHDTGKVRGLLCHGCNVGIGHLKDSVTVLQNAIDYLT